MDQYELRICLPVQECKGHMDLTLIVPYGTLIPTATRA